ncbi:MAG: hypothetical protein R3C16_00465 [Hyphomonadaceae bacterium]
MADDIVLSIDAMGGDHAPDIVVEGSKKSPPEPYGCAFRPARRRRATAALLEKSGAKAVSRVEHAEKAIGTWRRRPAKLRQEGKGSSLWNAIAMVEEGRANAVVSAGNTGAYMAIAMMRLRKMEGIHRPALAARWPAMNGGYVVMLDVAPTSKPTANNWSSSPSWAEAVPARGLRQGSAHRGAAQCRRRGSEGPRKSAAPRV